MQKVGDTVRLLDVIEGGVQPLLSRINHVLAMAAALEAQRLMTRREAEAALRGFLIKGGKNQLWAKT